ncbi:MAG: T9SS type A sorting domain-containing protein [Gemmatimonadota bacterium]|nr:MAG: T9SS type A sorting domain-containing protein [Gemmatimonadota bacterium]
MAFLSLANYRKKGRIRQLFCQDTVACKAVELIPDYSESCPVEDSHDGIGIPKNFVLYQNYPNPFNPITKIAFDLPKECDVDLSVYNVLGQKVETVIGRKLVAGHHEVVWNAESAPSGVYFYTITAGEFSAMRKMILMK